MNPCFLPLELSSAAGGGCGPQSFWGFGEWRRRKLAVWISGAVLKSAGRESGRCPRNGPSMNYFARDKIAFFAYNSH
jgi:hypothetical protein